MDSEIVWDQRSNSADDLGGVLSVFSYPSGTGDPTCLCLSVGDRRLRAERDHHHDLFPRAEWAVNTHTSFSEHRSQDIFRDFGAFGSLACEALRLKVIRNFGLFRGPACRVKNNFGEQIRKLPIFVSQPNLLITKVSHRECPSVP